LLNRAKKLNSGMKKLFPKRHIEGASRLIAETSISLGRLHISKNCFQLLKIIYSLK
jgi:hypothetical protein